MTDVSFEAGRAAAPTRDNALYRAIWRWHFYAGLISLPFIVLLAVTGAVYLFKPQLDRVIYRSMTVVEARAAPMLKHSELIAAATTALNGPVNRYLPAGDATSSAEVVIRPKGSDRISIFVDPYSGQVLGQVAEQQNALWIIRKLHSLQYLGDWTNYIIEIVGGWAIILALTGVYLWLPRGRSGGAVSVRGTPKKRVFWRDLHAVTGVFTAVFLVFLAVTGMPWSAFWGKQVNSTADANGFGYPTGVWSGVPQSSIPMSRALGETSWTLQNAPMPLSTVPKEFVPAKPIGIDAAMQRFAAMGLKPEPGLRIGLPATDTGVFTAQLFADDVSRQRTIHLDQYRGFALVDVSISDYGLFARVAEWGISIHMGKQFGLINQIILAIACLAMVLMSVAAAVMWWKRRPTGGLGAPQRLTDDRVGFGIVVIAVVIGVIYPLVGASIIAFLVVDMLIPRRLKLARSL
jgi:uncharacterized iron-regulated membrane protein